MVPGPLAKEELPAITDAFSAALAALPPADVVHGHYWLSAVASLPVARAWGVHAAAWTRLQAEYDRLVAERARG